MKRPTSHVTAAVMVITLIPAVAIADGHGECGDPYTPIAEIQGDGSASPIVGQTVITEAS